MSDPSLRKLVERQLEVASLSGEVHAVMHAIVERMLELPLADGASLSTCTEGIAHFEVRCNEFNSSFWLVRTNGTSTDFSFKHCLTPRTPLYDFKQAAARDLRQPLPCQQWLVAGIDWQLLALAVLEKPPRTDAPRAEAVLDSPPLTDA